MYLNRLTEILDYLFGLRPKPAPCPVPKSTSSRRLFVVAAILLSTRAAEASVDIYGDVMPADDQFTLNIIEALPSAGNKVEPFAPVDAQTLWEGYYDPVNNTNINANVFVGVRASGTLQISQVPIRDMNLVIGDSIPTGQGQGITQNDGTVFITGFGSLFNNDPYKVPSAIIVPHPNFSSKNPRLTA